MQQRNGRTCHILSVLAVILLSACTPGLQTAITPPSPTASLVSSPTVQFPPPAGGTPSAWKTSVITNLYRDPQADPNLVLVASLPQGTPIWTLLGSPTDGWQQVAIVVWVPEEALAIDMTSSLNIWLVPVAVSVGAAPDDSLNIAEQCELREAARHMRVIPRGNSAQKHRPVQINGWLRTDLIER